MKKAYIISMAAAAALMTFSCNKENNVPADDAVVESAVKSFIVEAPQTKTSIDGLSVKWAAGDEITVYGYTTDQEPGKATFQLTSAPGSTTGTFTIKEGDTMGEYDNYYAFYPASIATSFTSGEIQVSSGINYDGQTAVEGGFDPKFALMTAKANAGTLTFRHAAAYFKVKVLEDNISEVKLTFGKNAAQKRPYFTAETGEISKNNGGTATLTSAGSFVKNSTYYIAAIPNTANKMTSLELSMTKSGATSSISSSAAVFNSTIELGHVYNLGAPVIDFSPVINADDPSKLANDATEGSFTFTVSNGNVSDVTVTKTTGDWITAFDATTVPGTVSFDCTANTGEERTATFTLSIAGGDDVVVTVTQKAVGGGAESHEYIFHLDDSGAVVQTADGDSGSFFTVAGSSKLLCSATGYFGVASYDIAGDTYTYAKKIDSSNNVSFTTRAGYTTTARFYAASRNTNTTATINFITGSTKVKTLSLTWTDNKADLLDSGVINLEAGNTYTFSKSGEVGVFYIIVNETE